MNDKLTLAAFAEFCESKPADQRYNYVIFNKCACAQYASEYFGLGPEWMHKERDGADFWDRADHIASKLPYTFGALAKRLRAASHA